MRPEHCPAIYRHNCTSESRVQFQASPFVICFWQSGITLGLLRVLPFFPVIVIPPLIQTHPFVYQRRYIIIIVVIIISGWQRR